MTPPFFLYSILKSPRVKKRKKRKENNCHGKKMSPKIPLIIIYNKNEMETMMLVFSLMGPVKKDYMSF